MKYEIAENFNEFMVPNSNHSVSNSTKYEFTKNKLYGELYTYAITEFFSSFQSIFEKILID